jgi:hypothetical protein
MTGTLNELLESGNLEAAEIQAKRLREAYPDWGYAQVMGGLFDRLPPPGSQSGFADDLRKEVQVVRRDGSDSVLLVFTGFKHELGFSLSVMHRWLGLLPASILYLRDFRSLFYLDGVPSLGRGVESTTRRLGEIAASLGGRRIFCCGCSGGLYASLFYGLALGAERILALAGPANLSPEFNAHLRSAGRVAHLWRTVPDAPVADLRRRYAEAERPPRVLLVYDRNNWDDRLHAEYMADLPSVRLEPLAERGVHAVIAPLIVNGKFEATLSWLLQDRDPNP